MNDIDHKIREALKGTAAGDALAGEPNIAEELLGIFRTRHRWLNTLPFILTFIFFGVAVWAGWHAIEAGTPREQVLWAALTLVAMMFVGFLKIYFWLELHTNRVLRELKRVELLLLQRTR